MIHISDRILELYALNRHSLDSNLQRDVYEHIGICTECRQVLTQLSLLWKRDIELTFEPIDKLLPHQNLVESSSTPISSLANSQGLESFGYFVAPSSEKRLLIAQSESDSILVVNQINDQDDSDSISMSKFNFLDKWLILIDKEPVSMPIPENFSRKELHQSSAILKISQDIISFSDEYMVTQHQQTVRINAHRPDLNRAVLRNPYLSISHHKSTSGIFNFSSDLWNKHTRLHLFQFD
jgi:hypothetical protein